MTMQPRTSDGSANSAARITCWYHSGKSSSRRGVIAVLSVDVCWAMRKRQNYAWRNEMTSDHLRIASQLFSGAGLQYQQMKAKLIYLLVPALTCVSQFAPALFAQQPPDRPDRPLRQFQNERRARLLANLTEDERAKLRAAHEKAMADPAVQAAREKLKQARREFREVLRPALLKADPSVQAILDKLRAERQDRADKP